MIKLQSEFHFLVVTFYLLKKKVMLLHSLLFNIISFLEYFTENNYYLSLNDK